MMPADERTFSSQMDSKNGKTQKPPNPLMANGSYDIPLRQKLIPLDNLAVTPMEHHLLPTRKVMMMMKTTKYKLVKRSTSEAVSVEQNCPHTNSIQGHYRGSTFFVISNPGLPFFCHTANSSSL